MRWLKRLFGGVKAGFEAVTSSWWGLRSYINAALQDVRFDANSATREELYRQSINWVYNNGLVQRIRNLFIQFSVGIGGLDCVPNSTNESWNENRKKTWLQWSRAPELGTKLPMGQLEIQWAGSLFDAGEIFIYKTADGQNRPMIQTIDPLRVATPPDLKGEEGKTIIDGIRLKQIPGIDGLMTVVGVPESYFVRSGNTIDGQYQYREIPAEQIIHKFKARRPGMMRGIPEGFSAFNVLHDMIDLQNLTMQKAKAAAVVMNVLTNAAGEADPATMRRQRLSIGSQNAAGAAVTKQDDQFYDVKTGAVNIALKTGEDFKQFRSDEPGVVTQNYWDYLTAVICCAYNVPKLLVLPYSLQGTVTRADLDICTNAFRANFELVAAAVRELYEWQTEWAVKYDRNQRNARPEDFLEVVIRPPRAPNVDIGRNAQALILELEAGTVTYQDIFAERQQDWRKEFRQSAEAAAYLKALAVEFDVDVADIASKIQGKATEPQPDSKDAQTAPTE